MKSECTNENNDCKETCAGCQEIKSIQTCDTCGFDYCKECNLKY